MSTSLLVEMFWGCLNAKCLHILCSLLLDQFVFPLLSFCLFWPLCLFFFLSPPILCLSRPLIHSCLHLLQFSSPSAHFYLFHSICFSLDLTESPQEEEKQTLNVIFFLQQLFRGKEPKTWRMSFNLWNLNWNELNYELFFHRVKVKWDRTDCKLETFGHKLVCFTHGTTLLHDIVRHDGTVAASAHKWPHVHTHTSVLVSLCLWGPHLMIHKQ